MLAIGPGGLDKEGKRVTPSVVPGDKVLIPQVRRRAIITKPKCEEYMLMIIRSMEVAQ